MREPGEQNCAIQLTGAGVAALAVVRLRGPGAKAFVARHFDRGAQRGRCVYGNWREDDGGILDDVVVVAGEGWFEVNLHGGPRVMARLLEQAQRAGFEVITGERAIEAAAEDEIEAWLPAATTETALRILLAQPEAWRRLEPGRADTDALLADRTLVRMLVPATVAIIGAPNVGKSTLANALFGQERAIVAGVPGTTRDWVGGVAELDGLPVVLIDTPGRRVTSDEIEREAIALSAGPVARADVVIDVIDATAPAWRGDAAEVARPSLRVANKCDLAPAPEGWLAVSAKAGAGLSDLIHAVHQALGVAVSGAHHEIPAYVWTDEQERLLREHGARAVAQIAHRLRKG